MSVFANEWAFVRCEYLALMIDVCDGDKCCSFLYTIKIGKQYKVPFYSAVSSSQKKIF